MNDLLSNVLHISIIIMDMLLIVFLFMNRYDRINYERSAKSEREYLIQVFARAVDRMSALIAQVEEEINGKE